MVEGTGLWTPWRVRDLKWSLGKVPFCIHPPDKEGRAGRECGAGVLVALLAQGTGRAEGLAGGAQ